MEKRSMAIEVIAGQSVWMVGATLPKDETKGRRYALTRTLMVVASTAERAIECAREHYGECVVYSVQHHRGNDAELVVAAEALAGSVAQ